MSAITGRTVEKYLYALLPESEPVLADMERHAARHDVPIVGPAVGRLLALMVQTSGAKRIFEMGSAIGYSTIWLARAAGPDGEVFYTDGSPANAWRAAQYIRRAGVAGRIHILMGDALELLDATRGQFDLIFNDVDKHQYPSVLRKAVPRLRKGGLFITDNTLWSGRAARKARRGDAATRGIREFNRMVSTSKSLFPVLVPLRDGVTICRKL